MREVSILSIVREIKKDNQCGWNLDYDYNSELICNLDNLLYGEDEEVEGRELYE